MTLPAIPGGIAVKAVKDGPAYTVGPKCANPGCRRDADHAHHIVRRSALGGDYRWIALDGHVVGNLAGVCWRCHNDLTGGPGGHKAAIRLDAGIFWWALPRRVGSIGSPIDYRLLGPIDPQPPTPESLDQQAPAPTPESDCPLCGQRRRAHRPGKRWARRRKTWTVKVPADAEEDGAEVLDALIENLALVIPNADGSTTGRYYVLVPTLAYATMDVERFLQTMEGVGG